MINSTKTRVTGVLLGLGLFAGCGDSSAGPGPDQVFFPLAVGNTWRYAPDNAQLGDPFQWEVMERVGDTVRLSRPAGGSHPGPVTLLDDTDAVSVSLDEGTFFPLHLFSSGSTWVRRDPWECDDGSTWTAVRESTPIATPAGTFSGTMRLERRTGATCTDAGTTFEWWAPGIGLVQWEELNFYAGGPLTFQLMSYTVH